MSDTTAYEIDGVTITPKGGGFYELTHPSLEQPVSERGKENADQRAKAIGAETRKNDDGSMPPQPNLDDAAKQLESQKQAEKDSKDDVAQLKKQLEEAYERADRAEEKVRTVIGNSGVEPRAAENQVPADVPREFSGQMSAENKKLLKKAGIETKKIILEENSDIPPTGLYLGHNGRGYVIVPGEEVEVPEFLIDVLNHATMSAPVVDSKLQKVLGYRDRLRYPYRQV